MFITCSYPAYVLLTATIIFYQNLVGCYKELFLDSCFNVLDPLLYIPTFSSDFSIGKLIIFVFYNSMCCHTPFLCKELNGFLIHFLANNNQFVHF